MSSEVQNFLNSCIDAKKGTFMLSVSQVSSECSIIDSGTTFILSGLPPEVIRDNYQIPNSVSFSSHLDHRFSIHFTVQRDSWGFGNPSYHHYEEFGINDLLGGMKFVEWDCDDDGEKYKAILKLDRIDRSEVYRLPQWVKI